jgi:hypothetical protein
MQQPGHTSQSQSVTVSEQLFLTRKIAAGRAELGRAPVLLDTPAASQPSNSKTCTYPEFKDDNWALA